MTRSLFVIEAPGKIKSMEGILAKLGLDAKVQATSGHLYEFPQELSELGIDKKFAEPKRRLRRDKTVWYLRHAAQDVDTIYIATDADTEGDVIAWDVHELLKDLCPDIMRLRLKGMDPQSVEESLNEVTPVRKEDAIPGRTRAIVDRMIGHTFSKDGVGVGRVATSLLGLVHFGKDHLSTTRVRLVAPAKDGTNPWVANFDTNKTVTKEIAEKLTQLSFPAIDMKARGRASNSLMHMGEVMVKAGDELGMTPKETAKSLQNMYETGQMSYPRSGAKGVSKGAQRRLGRMIKKSGFRGASENLAGKDEKEVHDAPYPIGDVDVSKDPRKLGDDHGVRTMVARQFVKSSLKREKQKANAEEIKVFLLREGFASEVAEYVAGRNWTREIGPRFPGEDSWPSSGIQERMPETVLLEKAVKLKLGRPSTWAKHIDSFMERGLCDDDFNLTEKGRRWVEASPKELLDPRVSRAIEDACETTLQGMMDHPDREPWSVLAEHISESLPGTLGQQVVVSLEEHVPGSGPSYDADIERIDGPSPTEPTQERLASYTPDIE